MEKKYLTSVGQLSPEEYLLRFAPIYIDLGVQQKPLIIYGCGPLTELLFARFDINKLNVLAFSDSNPGQWGQEIYQKKIIPPDEINHFDDISVLMISGSSQIEIKYNLEKKTHENLEIIPAFRFNFNHNLERNFPSMDKENIWAGKLKSLKKHFNKNQKILFLIEGNQIDPRILVFLKFLKNQNFSLEIITPSPYLYKGLKERAFIVHDLEAERNAFKTINQNNSDPLKKEGEMIRAVNQSPLFQKLTFPLTHTKVFEALFYDRMIFDLFNQIDLEEFTNEIITKINPDISFYSGPLNSAYAISFIKKCQEIKCKTIVYPFIYKENPLIGSFLEKSDIIFSKDQLNKTHGDSVHLITTLEKLKNLPLIKPNFCHPITLIPFSLKKRWEIRELVIKQLKKKSHQQGTIIIKCREKMNSFNGAISEIDFCRQYMKGILDSNKNIILVDDQLTDLELVYEADKILNVESNGITEIADTLKKSVQRTTGSPTKDFDI